MNIHDYTTKQLKEGEELVRLVRRHPVVLVPPLGLGIFLVLTDFFLMAWWFRHGWWGVGLWLFILILSAWWIFRTVYIWSLNVMVLTNQRVIDINQRGVFDRRVAEAPYDKIQDVRYTIRGMWQTLLSFGVIVLQTAGSTTNLELTNVRHPVELQQLITDLMGHAAAKSDTAHLSAEELLKLVDRLKNELGPEGFTTLLNKSKNS